MSEKPNARWEIFNDGPGRWVLVDNHSDDPSPVYETEEAAKAAEGALVDRRLMTDWQPIETAPIATRLLFWWRPIDNNPYAETCIIGEISVHEPGKWWNSQRGAYQDVWHLTHWMPLPPKPTPPAPASGENGGM